MNNRVTPIRRTIILDTNLASFLYIVVTSLVYEGIVLFLTMDVKLVF